MKKDEEKKKEGDDKNKKVDEKKVDEKKVDTKKDAKNDEKEDKPGDKKSDNDKNKAKDTLKKDRDYKTIPDPDEDTRRSYFYLFYQSSEDNRLKMDVVDLFTNANDDIVNEIKSYKFDILTNDRIEQYRVINMNPMKQFSYLIMQG